VAVRDSKEPDGAQLVISQKLGRSSSRAYALSSLIYLIDRFERALEISTGSSSRGQGERYWTSRDPPATHAGRSARPAPRWHLAPYSTYARTRPPAHTAVQGLARKPTRRERQTPRSAPRKVP
jgi:hypothetical protein